MNNYYNKRKKKFARSLRKRQTHGEAILWKCLRRRQLNGLRFLRQRSMLIYVVDFLQPDCKLIIEIDGSSHDEEKYDYDQRRQKELEDLGYEFLRFTEYAAVYRTDEVLQSIRNFVEAHSLAHSPSPSPEGSRRELFPCGE